MRLVFIPDAFRVTDLNIMFKVLKLAWIPRILASDKRNWCTIPNHLLKKMGGLNFLLRCNSTLEPKSVNK